MRIRRMREEDIGQIVRLLHNVYGKDDASLFLRDIRISLSMPKNSPYKFEDFYVAEIAGEIVAAGGAWALHYEPVARLDWFIVGSGHQKRGLGTLLLSYIEKEMKKRGISVLVAETSSARQYRAAVAFYERNGFRKVAQIEKYWPDGSAWVYFMKRI